MPSIYLAGKIAKNDWRHDVVKGLRGTVQLDGPIPTRWPVLKSAVFGFDYTGPYPMSCDHGCGHAASHATASGWCGDGDSPKDRAATHALCLDAIARSDTVFAWLDDFTAYGTLVEIGYARGLGKRVIIAAPQLPEQVEVGHNFVCEIGPADLWFAFASAHAIFEAPEPVELLRQMIATHQQVNARTDSPIEAVFWREHLKQKLPALDGLVTQHSVGRYRLDFAIPHRKFGIELDGFAYHSDKETFVRDRARQRELEALGWRIVRFAGVEITTDVTACVRQAGQLAATLI